MGGKSGGAPAETALDKQLAANGVEKYNRYVTKYQPLENYAINQSTSGWQAHADQNLGTANANYQQQFGISQPTVVSNLGRQTLGNANSGSFKLGLGQYATNQGTAMGMGAVDTGLANEATRKNNLQSLITTGQGKASDSSYGYNTAADASNKQAIIDARASSAANNAYQSAIGTSAGYGIGKYKDSVG